MKSKPMEKKGDGDETNLDKKGGALWPAYFGDTGGVGCGEKGDYAG